MMLQQQTSTIWTTTTTTTTQADKTQTSDAPIAPHQSNTPLKSIWYVPRTIENVDWSFATRTCNIDSVNYTIPVPWVVIGIGIGMGMVVAVVVAVAAAVAADTDVDDDVDDSSVRKLL
jgi:hypothetical protein